MILYKTVMAEGEAEQEIKKSRFITHVRPVEDYDEARAFVDEIKNEYKDATHNVPAIVCGDKQQVQWASDDGEPQGTSGAPMLRLAVDMGLTDLAIVVTRYFGGTKLGTGGLVRAYSSSARLGIENAGTAAVKDQQIIKYRVDYTFLGKINNAAENGFFYLQDVKYTDAAVITASCDVEDAERVNSFFMDLTSGRCEELERKIKKIKVKI